ncbi:ROK family protein [Arthrobacter castelli]|uniref:ROK family protein n=1 Tax=Arthrobacter castelli TaxID=271431 RepID=UPI0004063D22|nr:ROK family protein [Arthrobacter castelli]
MRSWMGNSAVLALDVGGTDMKVGIILPSNRIIGLQRLASPRDPTNPGEALLDAVCALVQSYQVRYPDHPFDAIGLVVPGLVDEAAGVGKYSANLGWKDFPFATRARTRLGMPVVFGHDVRAAGDAEFRIGAAQHAKQAVVMVVGTGIAGALFCDGHRLTGDGYAGELGHSLVPDPKRPGEMTILEAVGSAGAIAARYTLITGDQVDGAREVLRLAKNGAQHARQVWNEAIDALGFSIAQCVSTLGSEIIVIGGGLSRADDALFVPLRRKTNELLGCQRRPRIIPAMLGQEAGLIGAALRTREMEKRLHCSTGRSG